MLRLQMSRFRRERKRSDTKVSKMPSWLDLEVGSETSSHQHGDQHKQDDAKPKGRNCHQKQLPSARLPSTSRRHKVPTHIFPESRDESVSTLGNRSFENRIEAEARHLKLIQKKREQGGAKQMPNSGVTLNDFLGNQTYNEQQTIQKNSSPVLDSEGEGANKWKETSQIHNDRDGPPATTGRGEKEAVKNVASYFNSSESPEGHTSHQDDEVESASHYFNTNEDSKRYAGHQEEEVKNASPYFNNSNEGLKQQMEVRNSSPYGDTSPYINVNEGPKRYVHTNQGPGRWRELSRINDERDEPPLRGSEIEL